MVWPIQHGMALGYITQMGAYGAVTGSPTCDGAGKYTFPASSSLKVARFLDGNEDESTPNLFHWLAVHKDTVPDPGGAAGTETRIYLFGGTTAYNLYAVKVDATYYNVRLKDTDNSTVIGTGSTNFAWGTAYDLLLESDGTNVRVWYGNPATKQIDVANTNRPLTDTTSGVTIYGVTGNHTCEEVVMRSGDGVADRPDPGSLDGQRIIVTVPGGTAMSEEFTVLTPGTGETKAADVDDWIGGGSHDSDTTRLRTPVGAAGAAYQQGFITTDPTMPAGIIVAVALFYVSRVASADKENTIAALYEDDDGVTTSSGGAIANTSTSYGFFRAIRSVDQSYASLWTPARINSLQIGVRAVTDPNTDNRTNLTAIQAEVLGMNLRFALERHRVPALGSANAIRL